MYGGKVPVDGRDAGAGSAAPARGVCFAGMTEAGGSLAAPGRVREGGLFARFGRIRRAAVLSAPVLLAGFLCGCYSFKGISIDPNIKTVNVAYFDNKADIVNPNLSPSFTEGLRNKIMNETSLVLTNQAGDISFSGFVSGYVISPIAPTAGETSALSRLEVTVKVDFTNQQDPARDWSNSFKYYADYSSTANFSAIEGQLTTEISEQIIDMVFTRAFVNW